MTPRPQTVRRSVAAVGSFEAPFPAGWFDRLMDWIDRQPGPNALWCAGLLVVQLGYMTAMLWVNDRLAVGTVDFSLVFVVAIIPYLLWSRFHLDRVAGAALDAFRPALPVDDPEFQRLRYELTTLSATTTRAVTLATAAIFLVNLFVVPNAIIQRYAPSVGVGLLQFAPIGLFSACVVAVSIAQAVHQLRMVERLHTLAHPIHLFRAKPL